MKNRDEFIERAWLELRKRVCSDPLKAKRCVMVNESDFKAAITKALSSK